MKEEVTNSDFEPRIVGFLCNWCSSTAADLAGVTRTKMPPNVTPLRVMCSSRIDPALVLRAFLGGADGVLLGGCHPGDCHYQTGNYHTRRRYAAMVRVFEELGLEAERLRLRWISAAEGARFARVTTEFTEHIRNLGPNRAGTTLFI